MKTIDGLTAYDIMNKYKDCPIHMPRARSMTQARIDFESREESVIEWYKENKQPYVSWFRRLIRHIFKYRMIPIRKKFPFVTLYLFQEGRWEFGLTFDVNGQPLFSINLISLHLEIDFDRSNY